jgi:hypothetical protein
MGSGGTQEAKRVRRAVPPALAKPVPVGCLVSLVASVTLAVLFALTKSIGGFVFGLGLVLVPVAIVGGYLYGLLLLALVQKRWAPRGVRCLLIYSDSPLWHDHIRTGWLPRFEGLAVTLDWSERASWRSDLRVRVFRWFVGQRSNFNPAVVVFRGLRRPYVFRFFYAFQETKAGRIQYVSTLESQMFEAIGVGKAV